MDEIEWWKIYKKIFKYIFWGGMLYAVYPVISGLIIYIFNHNYLEFINTIKFGLIAGLGPIIFFGIIYLTAWLINKLTNMKIDINFSKEYIRELNNEYPPAIVSLIYDKETEVYKDYTATILGLYIKKYINIIDFKEEVSINKGENENLSNLLKHELYIYNCMIDEQKFDEYIFKQYVLDDAQEKELLTIAKYRNTKYIKIFLAGVLLIIALIILLIKAQSFLLKSIIIIILSTILAIYCVLPVALSQMNTTNDSNLTRKGKKELKKIKAFKNFIKDYTLIEEKDIEYIQILDEYIPYSLSLGTSPQVEEYIKQNEIYRNLIYKGRKQ